MSRFPYERYEKTPLRAVLSRVVDSLESNGDLEVTTAKRYIIGYLAQQLDEAGLLLQVPPLPVCPAMMCLRVLATSRALPGGPFAA